MPAEFAGREDALFWLDAERPNLISAVALAAATGRDERATSLALSLTNTCRGGAASMTRSLSLIASRDCARRQGDQAEEAAVLNGLGVVLLQVRRFDEAIDCFQEALAISREPATGTARA